MNDLNKRIELEALITEREGMVAENQRCEILEMAPTHREFNFRQLGEKIRALKEPASSYTPEDVARLVEAARKRLTAGLCDPCYEDVCDPSICECRCHQEKRDSESTLRQALVPFNVKP